MDDFKSAAKDAVIAALVVEEVRRIRQEHRQDILDDLRDQVESGVEVQPADFVADRLMETADIVDFHEQLPAKQKERLPFEEPKSVNMEELERMFLDETTRQARFLLE